MPDVLPFVTFLASVTSLICSATASPTPDGLLGLLQGGDYSAISASLAAATATNAPPSAASEASARLSSVFDAQPTDTDILTTAENLLTAGLTTDNGADALNFVDGLLNGQNSQNNINLRNPQPPAYPRAGPKDAPYDLPEAQLRGAIYIPPAFQYGAKGAPQPIILVPGTGDTGYTTFIGNYIPLLQGSTIGDPVWLNIPGFLLNDAQTNSEYVAYAINYIYGISNHRKPAVLGWSQGNINIQRAFKYWPSARRRVTDHVAFSPDYHGTVLANLIDVGEPLPPSIIQQEYNSNYITTLRSNGGDSSYVPTTTVYSSFFDEIVEPQLGRNASAFLKNARGAGVSNNQVQLVCPPGSPAGSFYTHEGTLYNPLGYALAVDALTHDGPGRRSRSDLDTVCATYLTPGLDVTDFLLTENTVLVAGAAFLLYPNKVFDEPPIKGKLSYNVTLSHS